VFGIHPLYTLEGVIIHDRAHYVPSRGGVTWCTVFACEQTLPVIVAFGNDDELHCPFVRSEIVPAFTALLDGVGFAVEDAFLVTCNFFSVAISVGADRSSLMNELKQKMSEVDLRNKTRDNINNAHLVISPSLSPGPVGFVAYFVASNRIFA
jgi:hypothetical protein